MKITNLKEQVAVFVLRVKILQGFLKIFLKILYILLDFIYYYILLGNCDFYKVSGW